MHRSIAAAAVFALVLTARARHAHAQQLAPIPISAQASSDPNAAIVVLDAAPGFVRRLTLVDPLSGWNVACDAPCRLTVTPGRYDVRIESVGATSPIERFHARMQLQPGTTRVRPSDVSGRRVGVGVLIAGGGLFVVGLAMFCFGLSQAFSSISFYGGGGSSAGGGLMTGGAIVGGIGAPIAIAGGIVLAANRHRVEIVARESRALPSLAFSRTHGGGIAALAWTF